jgi:hypothetical protein
MALRSEEDLTSGSVPEAKTGFDSSPMDAACEQRTPRCQAVPPSADRKMHVKDMNSA